MTGRNPRPVLFFLASMMVLLGVAVVILGAAARRPMPACPPGLLCIDPARTTGFVFDMGVDGWRPVTREDRTRISYLVSEGKAEYAFQAEGVDLYEIDPKGLYLGPKVATLQVEWWRPVRRKP